MGQAKNRGTYEQRRAESIAAAADELRERAEKAKRERVASRRRDETYASRAESDAMPIIAPRRPGRNDIRATALLALVGGLTPR